MKTGSAEFKQGMEEFNALSPKEQEEITTQGKKIMAFFDARPMLLVLLLKIDSQRTPGDLAFLGATAQTFCEEFQCSMAEFVEYCKTVRDSTLELFHKPPTTSSIIFHQGLKQIVERPFVLENDRFLGKADYSDTITLGHQDTVQGGIVVLVDKYQKLPKEIFNVPLSKVEFEVVKVLEKCRIVRILNVWKNGELIKI